MVPFTRTDVRRVIESHRKAATFSTVLEGNLLRQLPSIAIPTY